MKRLLTAPSLCWEEWERDGLVLHCTEPSDHEGRHQHAYSKTEWPNIKPPSAAEAATR